MRLKIPLSLALSSLLIFSNTALAAPKKVNLQGQKLGVLISDNQNFTKSEIEYNIIRGKKRIKLKFPHGRAPEGLRTGMTVNVKGKQLSAGAIEVGSDSSSFQITAGSEVAGIGGVRQVVVLKLISQSAQAAATAEHLTSVMNRVKSWYTESSYGQLTVANDRDLNGINDFYAVNIAVNSAGSTDTWGLCNQAKTAVKNQHGIDPAQYQHTICILPPDMTYSWFGTAWIGGTDSVINGNYAHGYAGGYVHELGHNLGMHHSNTPGVEYGESSCVMGGNAGTADRDFNAPHKTNMGWVTAQTAGAGSYELNAVELQSGSRTAPNTVLKIRDAVASVDLFISYRAPLGTFSPGLSYPYRTSVHEYRGGSTQPVLLASLGDGEMFSRNGISVTQSAHTTTTASVQIGANCSAAAPSLTLSPSSVTTNTLGTKSFTLTVKNNDVNCSSSVNFGLAIVAPSGWTASTDSASVTLAPGQSAATGLTVTPAAGSASQRYDIPVSASAAGHPQGSTIVYFTLDTTAPSAVSNLTGSAGRRGKVNLSWSSASDSGSGVSTYLIFRNGAQVGSTAGTSYTDSAGSGTFSYYVVARDGAGNTGVASNTISVTTASSGGGKKGNSR